MNRRTLLRSSLLLLVNAGLFAQGRLTVTVLDFTTHGLSIVLDTPGGKTWLIDAGLRPTGDYYAARDAIVPFLKKAGVKRFDGVVISHPHGDHYGGLPYIMERYPIAQLVDAGYDEIGGGELETYREIRAKYVAGGGKSVIVRQGDKVTLDRGLEAEILWPPRQIAKAVPPKTDDSLYNAMSMVMRVQHGANVLLFPGDMHGLVGLSRNVGAEKLKCDLLIAPHHGINSTAAMAKVTKPRIVATAVKEFRDSKQNPTKLTRAAFATVGSEMYFTWVHGHITIVSDGRTLKVTTQRKP